MPSPSIVLARALEYLSAGLSVIPIHPDGSKAPLLMRGHPVLNRERPATDDECRKWWRTGTAGIAVLCGRVSGHAECIDFDRRDLFGEWYQLAAATVTGLMDRLALIETPNGYHAWYRCAEPVQGNQKLAVEPATHEGRPAVRTLIETRGEGGYAIVPGGPDQVHASKKPYRHSDGRPLTQLDVFTAAERQIMLGAARAFNRHCEEPRLPPKADTESLRPGDLFNQQGPDWPAILEPHGWRALRKHGAVTCWQRPGKDGKGISATTGACKAADGCDLFYVFSSNAHPFSPRMGYSKFRAYAILNHAGNLSQAAAALRADGYVPDNSPKNSSTPRTAAHTLPPSLAITPSIPSIPTGPEECFTADELMRMKLPEPRWAVPELISEGLSILGGRPKTGKSWLALHIACQIASGGMVLGTTKVQQGPVLYLALEDTRRRLQSRLRKVLEAAPPPDLHLRIRWPRVQEGGDQLLRAWIAQHKPRLVILDTLAKLRGARRSDDAYGDDYDFVGKLKAIADKEQVAMLVLHHTSKSPRTDPVDEISGTLGIGGAADSILVLKRARCETECTLFLTGRDIEQEREIAITADVANKVFRNHGSAAEMKVSRERADILALLARHPEGLRPREIADHLAKSGGAIRVLLWKMTDDNQVRTDSGRYLAISPAPVPTSATAQ